MAYSLALSEGRPLEFSLGELTGALGDSITVLPVIVAAAAVADLSIGVVLLGFGVCQVVWGLHYRVPISVEPMKALAALVIAGSLSAAGLAAAGLIAGIVLLVGGVTGTVARLRSLVGQPVVRGVQLAVALVLVRTGVELSLLQPPLALGAGVVMVVLALVGAHRLGTLAVLGIGGAVAALQVGWPTPAVPPVGLALPGVSLLADPGVLSATGGQLALTVGNAAVATSLLLSEYYRADVSADDLSTSMGAMNLAVVPLGALPMCHGSGGVAGKYAFGAQSAGANVLLGVGYGLAALVAVELVAAFPMAVLGVLLVAVALQLDRTALDGDQRVVTAAVGVFGVVFGIGAAFIAGLLAWQLRDHVPTRRAGG